MKCSRHKLIEASNGFNLCGLLTECMFMTELHSERPSISCRRKRWRGASARSPVESQLTTDETGGMMNNVCRYRRSQHRVKVAAKQVSVVVCINLYNMLSVTSSSTV